MTDLIVFALPAEAPDLFSRYSNVHAIGVGKVSAAVNLMQLVFQHQPGRIINFGTAGGVSVSAGIHRVQQVWQHDVNMLALGLLPGEHLSETDNARITLPGSGVTCASGDLFVTEPHKIRQYCDIVDMEAYSVARVAKVTGTDVEIWKYISDAADTTAAQDWQSQVSAGQSLYISTLHALHARLIEK